MQGKAVCDTNGDQVEGKLTTQLQQQAMYNVGRLDGRDPTCVWSSGKFWLSNETTRAGPLGHKTRKHCER